jgi:predicted membrane protein
MLGFAVNMALNFGAKRGLITDISLITFLCSHFDNSFYFFGFVFFVFILQTNGFYLVKLTAKKNSHKSLVTKKQTESQVTTPPPPPTTTTE